MEVVSRLPTAASQGFDDALLDRVANLVTERVTDVLELQVTRLEKAAKQLEVASKNSFQNEVLASSASFPASVHSAPTPYTTGELHFLKCKGVPSLNRGLHSTSKTKQGLTGHVACELIKNSSLAIEKPAKQLSSISSDKDRLVVQEDAENCSSGSQSYSERESQVLKPVLLTPSDHSGKEDAPFQEEQQPSLPDQLQVEHLPQPEFGLPGVLQLADHSLQGNLDAQSIKKQDIHAFNAQVPFPIVASPFSSNSLVAGSLEFKALDVRGTRCSKHSALNIRVMTEKKILASLSNSRAQGSHIMFPFVLRNIPWVSNLCAQLLILIYSLTILSLLVSGYELSMPYLNECSLLLFSFASLLGIYALQKRKADDAFGHSLSAYASQYHFMDCWEIATGRLDWAAFFGGILCVAAFLLSKVLYFIYNLQTMEYKANLNGLSFACHLFSSFAFICSTSLLVAVYRSQSNLLIGLDQMLDVWMAGLMSDCDFQKGISTWNVVQAVMRQSSRGMEHAFLSVKLCGFASLLFLEGQAMLLRNQSLVGGRLCVHLVAMLPLFFLALLAFLISFQTSALTEKCSDLPSLVNQLEPDAFDSMHQVRDKLHLVESITHSSAGIYVKGVRFGGPAFCLDCCITLVSVIFTCICFIR